MNTPNPTPDPLPLIYSDPVVQVEVRVQEYPYGRGRPGAGVQFTLSNGRDVIAARLPRESARGLALSILAAVDPAEIPAAASVVSTEGSGQRCPSRIAHESGAVLGCSGPDGHGRLHATVTGEVCWMDDDDRIVTTPHPYVEGSGHPHPHGDDDGHDGYMSTRCEEGRPGCVGRGCICRCHADQPGPGPWTGPRPTLTPPDTEAPDLDSPDLPSQGRPVRQVRIDLHREGDTDANH